MPEPRELPACVSGNIDDSSNWSTINPIVPDGAICVERAANGVRLMKIGNGTTRYNSLPYMTDQEILNATEAFVGLTRYATSVEAGALTSNLVTITPKTLGEVLSDFETDIVALINIDIGKYSNLPLLKAAAQRIAANVETSILTEAAVSGTLAATLPGDGTFGLVIPTSGVYRIDTTIPLMGVSAPGLVWGRIFVNSGASRQRFANIPATWDSFSLEQTLQLNANDVVRIKLLAGMDVDIYGASAGSLTITRVR